MPFVIKGEKIRKWWKIIDIFKNLLKYHLTNKVETYKKVSLVVHIQVYWNHDPQKLDHSVCVCVCVKGGGARIFTKEYIWKSLKNFLWKTFGQKSWNSCLSISRWCRFRFVKIITTWGRVGLQWGSKFDIGICKGKYLKTFLSKTHFGRKVKPMWKNAQVV